MENLAYNPAFAPTPIVVSQCGGAQDTFRFVGEVEVNGVHLPLQVLEQLRQAGISAAGWLSAGELQDAVDACKYDGRLVDDHHGGSLRDKMTLTHTEQISRRRKRKPLSYEQMILEERNGKHHEHEDEPSHLLAF